VFESPLPRVGPFTLPDFKIAFAGRIAAIHGLAQFANSTSRLRTKIPRQFHDGIMMMLGGRDASLTSHRCIFELPPDFRKSDPKPGVANISKRTPRFYEGELVLCRRPESRAPVSVLPRAVSTTEPDPHRRFIDDPRRLRSRGVLVMPGILSNQRLSE